MIKAGVTPVCGGMAVITLIITLYMIRCLAIRPDIVMTTFATLGGSNKKAADMATLTIHVSMPTRERETGGEVIKFCTGGCQQSLAL